MSQTLEVVEVASATSIPATSTALAPQLILFLRISLILTVLCAAAEIFCKRVLHLDGAYIYPLKTPSQTFWDFTLYTGKFQHFHHPAFFLTDPEIYFTYPAPAAVAYKLFFLSSHPLRLFVGFILGSFIAAATLLGRALHSRGVSILKASAFLIATLLLSFPLWFELKQGNIEICSWVLIALGVWAFSRDKTYTAAACFGVAASMKIFPFVYLGLLLSARKFREAVFSALIAIASTLASLWLVGPDILSTWRQLNAGIAKVRSIYMLQFRPEEIGFDHSLFAVYKRFLSPHFPHLQIAHALTLYLAVMLVAGTLLYFLKIRRLPLINQVLCLSIASILLTPISFDYNLIYLYIPWAMLVLLAQQCDHPQRTTAGLTAAFACMAILMSPESEFIRNAVHFGGQIKALVLVALLCVGLKYPFTPTRPLRPAEPL